MKSNKTFQTIQTIMTQNTMKQKEPWKSDFQDQLKKIKQPFINRIEFSKLKIQSKISNMKNQNKAILKYEGLIQCLTEKFLHNQLPPPESKTTTEQSEYDPTEKHIRNDSDKQNALNYDDDSEYENESELPVDSHFTEWQGRDRKNVFKNSTNVQEQFDRVFNKKLGLSHPSQKKESYSYRRQEKAMLEKVYDELKDPNQGNCVTFKRMYKFFDDCTLFFTVYGISNAELQDIVSCSAHKYPDRLTREEFLELFLVNTQSRVYDEMQSKMEKRCCMEEANWEELRGLFNQLDTFGRGTIRTGEFLHKMKTVSASKELLECKVILFSSINKYYTFSKVLFELEHKINMPSQISWTDLRKLISEFSHIDSPTLDEVVKEQVMSGAISHSDTNTFLIKDDTIKLLKDQFSRCPKFNQHFVKCKYFCDELMSLEAISSRSKQLVRNVPNGKGFVNLLANIRTLQLQGPEYFDMDEMLTYFSVRGFQTEIKMEKLRKSVSAQSTTSEDEWEEKKREQRRAKRMKSLNQMDKIMKKMHEPNQQKQEKPVLKPVTVQQFNLTKPRDHMTIRQRKVKQMLKQKQQKQLSQMKPCIPANPIPASINGQRYQEDQARYQTKRELEKEKRRKEREEDNKKIKDLMSNTKLFQKRDPFLVEEEKRKYMPPQPKQEFEAKPISWFIKETNLLEVIQSQKQEKRKNRLRQTKEKYVFGYWKSMPYQKSMSNFKKMTIIHQLEAYKNTDESLQFELNKADENFDKAKSSRVNVGMVPDFAKLQKDFTEELESKKKMRSPTVVKEFNLSVPKKRQPQVIEEKVIKKAFPPKRSETDLQSSITQRPAIVGTTKKFESMVEMTQRKMSLKKYVAELEEQQQKERRKKEKIFAKFMKKAIKEDESNHHCSESIKSTRRRNDKSTIEHQKQLKKMYERVLSRPFLFQTASESQHMKKKGRKGKYATKRQEPQKVRIPADSQQNSCYPIIPPLNYIQEESQDYEDGDYDDGQFIVRDFDVDSEEFQEEDGCEQSARKDVRNVCSQLNQSF